MKPKLLLQIEGAAFFIFACISYQHLHGSWLWFALLFLTPDLSMLGYFINKKAGTAAYNFVHTYTTPLLLSLILWLSGQSTCLWMVLIWVAHIGLDRLFGYGLKYETAFKDTHFNRL